MENICSSTAVVASAPTLIPTCGLLSHPSDGCREMTLHAMGKQSFSRNLRHLCGTSIKFEGKFKDGFLFQGDFSFIKDSEQTCCVGRMICSHLARVRVCVCSSDVHKTLLGRMLRV